MGSVRQDLKYNNFSLMSEYSQVPVEEVLQEAPVKEASATDETVDVFGELAPLEEAIKEEVSAEETVEEAPAEEATKEEVSAEETAEEVSAEEAIKEEVSAEEISEYAPFSWDDVEVSKPAASKDRKALTALYEETLGSSIEHQVVEGKVTAKTDREVIIDINSKSEGVVSLNEFRYNPDLAVGDAVEVLVDRQEDKNGQLVLSHRKARSIKAWDRVNEAHESDEIVKGYVKARTKGGMIVDVFGLEAFLPGSQIDVKPIRDYDQYVDKTMEFKVVKINHEFKNVVVSHKALIELSLIHI